MNKNNQYFIRRTTVCLLLGLLVISSAAFGRRSREDATERNSRNSELDARREERRQEALQSFPELNNALKTILNDVSKNQHPPSETIERAVELLDTNKRNGSVYDDKQKAQFMLLQAWTDYYQKNLVDAVRWSMRACRTNEASQDAWISQAVFSMIVGKRPMLPRLDKPKGRPRRSQDSRRRGNEEFSTAEYGSVANPYSEKGELEFDLMGLKPQLFNEQFSRMKYKAVDGSEIEYVPGTDILCILFWKVDESVSDDDSSHPDQKQKQRSQNQATDPMMMGMGMNFTDSYGLQGKTLQHQRDYMQKLKKACQSQPKIKFVQINTNKAEAAKKAAEEAAKDPGIVEAGPLVFAADPASKAQGFMGLKEDDPFIMIIDKEGEVRYAGTAADFVPAFILTELTGLELNLEKMNQTQNPSEPLMPGQPARPAKPTAKPGKSSPTPMEMMMFEPTMGMPRTARPNPVADPNKVADPNTLKARQSSRTSNRASDFPTQSLEDQARAEKLLQSAEMEIGKSLKLRSNPKKGIKDCRKILAEFPNTQYAQKARELLRKVPERYIKMNHITDEELGY